MQLVLFSLWFSVGNQIISFSFHSKIYEELSVWKCSVKSKFSCYNKVGLFQKADSSSQIFQANEYAIVWFSALCPNERG
jgi:hypothetical protein